MTLYCSSAPRCQPCLAPGSSAGQTAAVPQHTQNSSMDSRRDRTHPVLGSAAVGRCLQPSWDTYSLLQPAAASTARALCTPEPHRELLPQPLSRAPPLSSSHLHTRCPQSFATDLPQKPASTAAPVSPPCLPGKPLALFGSCTLPEHQQKTWGATFHTGKAQGTHCVFPTWLGWVK